MAISILRMRFVGFPILGELMALETFQTDGGPMSRVSINLMLLLVVAVVQLFFSCSQGS